MRKIAIFIAVAALLLLGATPALANGIPKLPHAFYGTVDINGSPAPDGVQVSATVDIGDIISTQNPVTTVGGGYGIGDNPYLLVQGYDIPDGATITFHVTNANGTAIGGTATFVAGGGPTGKNLSVLIAEPEPEPDDGDGDGGGGGFGPTFYIQTNLFGTEGSYHIGSSGKILETIEATSADGNLTVDKSPPAAPEDAHIIGLAYDFGPDGATFDPPITFTWSYDPDALPEDVAEEDLVIAYYDEAAGKWVELDGVVDTENNTITASVSHFTTFAIIGTVTPPPPPPTPAAFTPGSLSISPTEVDVGEAVTISISVANTGGQAGSYTVMLKINDAVEETKEVTVAAGASETVTFTTSKDKAGTYAVDVNGLTGSFMVKEAAVSPPPPSPVNWPVIGGIIAAGVVIVGLLIFFLVRRRARARQWGT